MRRTREAKGLKTDGKSFWKSVNARYDPSGFCDLGYPTHDLCSLLNGDRYDPPGQDGINLDTSLFIVSLKLVDSISFNDSRDAGEDRELVSRELEFGVFLHFFTGERCTLGSIP